MSIFKETINSKVSDSLSLRQELMGTENRTPKEILFLNSNTSWVSLKSAININDKPDLAKSNVLEGGSLFFGKLRYGVGEGSTNAYSLKNTLGEKNILGIRPMPGITSVTIDNIGAYGSTRKATINYQCWDIKQLEILEQLYMRPGYLVLLEFGRTTYLQKENGINNIKQVVPTYDFFSRTDINLLNELRTLYKTSIESKGNYDAFLGYVVNYGWQSRDDGGYDCKTEIISTGEILESLKTNYSLATNVDFQNIETGNSKFTGLIFPNFKQTNISSDDQKSLNQDYSTNILLGLIRELYLLGKYNDDDVLKPAPPIKYTLPNPFNPSLSIDLFQDNYDSPDADPGYKLQNGSNRNYYITLESFTELINDLVIPESGKKGALTKISVKDREYLGHEGQLLNCLYNVLMTSVDPDVCIIKNDYWLNVLKNTNIDVNIEPIQPIPPGHPDLQDGKAIDLQVKIAGWIKQLLNESWSDNVRIEQESLIIKNIHNDYANWKKLNSKKSDSEYFNFLQRNYQIVRGGKSTEKKIPSSKTIVTQGGESREIPEEKTIPSLRAWNYIGKDSKGNIGDIRSLKKELQKKYPIGEDIHFIDLFKTAAKNIIIYGSKDTELVLVVNNLKSKKNNDAALDNQLDIPLNTVNQAIETKQKLEESQTTLQQVAHNYELFLNKISSSKSFVTSNTSGRNFGIIGNIYLNLKYLYKLANDANVKSQDPNEKSHIQLTQFIRTMIKDVQASIGNVNNFEIQIDDRDGIGRIIDLNYVGREGTPFQFEIGSNKSIIRDLKLESKIFSDQMAMIAISAQGDAGKLGMDNDTLVAFNKGITDRMLPHKNTPSVINENDDINNLVSSLSGLTNQFFSPYMETHWANTGTYSANSSTSYKDYLRDIIVFFTNAINPATKEKYNTDNKQSMLLPTQISFTMDGVAGLVIGNLFTVDKTFVPKSYREEGKEVGYTIIKVGHQIQNNDWTTNIEGIQYVPDKDPKAISNPTDFSLIITYSPSTGGSEVIVKATPSPNAQAAYDKAEKETPGFKTKVQSVAKAIGAAEMDLVKIMFIESAMTLNPGIKNNIGCVGLIQFCPDEGEKNIKTIGKKTYQLSQLQTMNRIQQMDVVQEYFQALGYNKNKTLSLTNMYLSTFYPAAVGKPGNFIIGSEKKRKDGSINTDYKFTVANQNPGIAADSTTYINNKKVIDVNAVAKFINK